MIHTTKCQEKEEKIQLLATRFCGLGTYHYPLVWEDNVVQAPWFSRYLHTIGNTVPYRSGKDTTLIFIQEKAFALCTLAYIQPNDLKITDQKEGVCLPAHRQKTGLALCGPRNIPPPPHFLHSAPISVDISHYMSHSKWPKHTERADECQIVIRHAYNHPVLKHHTISH